VAIIEKTVKRVIRKVVRTIRKLSESQDGPLDGWAAPYTLNSTYVRVMERPGCEHGYTWGVVQGVNLAKVLGLDRVSVIEFGVAGGNGLIALERIAEEVEPIFGVKVDVFGFDTGSGLTKPLDYRDMPNLWSEGYFPMDIDKLRQRLSRAQLILGPVHETVPNFRQSDFAPLAFVAFDVDLYSSTTHALSVFDANHRSLLPRVYCLFDDILGYTFGNHVGERLAISDFNVSHDRAKISPIYGLYHYAPERYAKHMWEKNYMAHFFDHPLYGRRDGSIPRPNPNELVLRS